jgi:hypothetical protein
MFTRPKSEFPAAEKPGLHPKFVTRPIWRFRTQKPLKNDAKPAAGQPVFDKAAENLYRLESSGG